MTDTLQSGAESAVDLDKLEALARAATPGDWQHTDRTVYVLEHHSWRKGVEQMRNRFSCTMSGDGSGLPQAELDANAEFIAAANPAAVLDLIALARRAAAPHAGPAPADIPTNTPAAFAKRYAELLCQNRLMEMRIAEFAAQPVEAAGSAVPTSEIFALYQAVNQMTAHIGMHGQIDSGNALVDDVMTALHNLDGGKVAQRVEDLVEKAFMPRDQATRLAVDEYCVTATYPAVPAVGGALVAIQELLGHISEVLDDAAWNKIDTAKWNAVSRLTSPTGALVAVKDEQQTQATRDVLAERRRQVEQEGWTPANDDEHGSGEMARAAACYALHTEPVGNVGDYLRFWPWDSRWWKPRDRRSNLVRAAALILAEIERLDRATQPTGNAEQGEQQ
jgi:hypothetical protein